jgi:class 3 adenylate cyclase
MAIQRTSDIFNASLADHAWSSGRRMRYLYFILGALVVFIYSHGNTSIVDIAGHKLFAVTMVSFAIVALARYVIDNWFFIQDPNLELVNKEFFISLGLYLIAGIIGYLLLTHFTESISTITGYKFFVGTAVYGYFVAVDNALNTERRCYYERRFIFAKNITTSSSTHRMRLFILTTILITVLAFYFSAHSILYYLSEDIKLDKGGLQGILLYDIIIMTVVIIGFSMRVAHTYSQNQKYLLDTQLTALQKIQKGNLESFVPIMSKDEFALIAQHTNKMLEELKEKQKITDVLERIVSPNIMQKLLADDANMLKRGQKYEVAILFCDLRRFTSFVENTPPDQVIRFLNAFFAKISDLISAHNGLINKFMGDAILAVFGIDGKEKAIQNAIQAAFHIISHTKTIHIGDNNKFDIGIGIHMGHAVAGTIGSAERYEYTFIGDVVNTASRLDGLSKRLGHRIVISDEVYRLLTDDLRSRFSDLGDQKIRGKSDAIHVYGAISDIELHHL